MIRCQRCPGRASPAVAAEADVLRLRRAHAEQVAEAIERDPVVTVGGAPHAARRSLARGGSPAMRRTTVAAYAATWIESYGGRTCRGIRPETLAEYRHDLAHTVTALRRRRLAEIGPPDLRALVAAWAD